MVVPDKAQTVLQSNNKVPKPDKLARPVPAQAWPCAMPSPFLLFYSASQARPMPS